MPRTWLAVYISLRYDICLYNESDEFNSIFSFGIVRGVIWYCVFRYQPSDKRPGLLKIGVHGIGERADAQNRLLPACRSTDVMIMA